MRTLHAAERQVLSAARAHAIAQAVEQIRAAHRTNQAQAFKDMMLRYEDRMAAALRDLPKDQHAAAIARLRDEQATEAAQLAENESAKLRDDEQRARAVIAGTYKAASGRLVRKQRDERLSLTLHLRQGFSRSFPLRSSRLRYRASTFDKRFARRRGMRKTGPRDPNSRH
jgi:hypothetical protein